MSSINILLTEEEIVKLLLEERARLHAERMQVRAKIDALYKQYKAEIDELPQTWEAKREDRTQGFTPVQMRRFLLAGFPKDSSDK